MSIHFPSEYVVTDYRELPTQPGVYFFFSPTGALLYIGKSKNLRSRVRTHLAATSGTSATLAAEFASIGYLVRGGELDTLLYESYAIKHFRPLLNHQLRSQVPAMAVTAKSNSSGYLQCQVLPFSPTLPNESIVLTLGRSKKKLQEMLQYHQVKHQLCSHLLGLEKTTSGCFAYQLGECLGACVGQESSSSYNQRLIASFEKKQVAAWPVVGPLAITEHNLSNHLTVTHSFLNWQHLHSEENVPDPLELYMTVGMKAEFSIDVYHILKRYLATRLTTSSPVRPTTV